jgi:hypothetical protein
VNLNSKFCKNCNKDYLEIENYNWSCRTHRVRCGGAVGRPIKMLKVASIPNMKVRKTKMKTMQKS